MKALKIIGGALVAIILIVPLFLSSDIHVERYQVMKASPAVIFPYLNNVEKMQTWGPWGKHDPTIKVVYGDTKEGEGAFYSWTGESIPSGTSIITGSTTNKEVLMDLTFDEEGGSKGKYILEEVEEGSKVTWSFDSKLEGFWLKRWIGIMMKRGSSQFMDEGLGYLKEIVEEEAANPPTPANYTINEIEYPAQQFFLHREKVSIADIEAFYGKHFTAMAGMVGDKMVGMPCGLFYNFDEAAGETDMAAAVPVSEAVEVTDGYELITLPGRSALSIDYYGPYEGSVAAHEAMEVYMNENGYTPSELPIIEQYVTDSSTKPDPKDWLTKIFYFADKG